MLKKSLLRGAAASLLLLGGPGLHAQPYSNAVVNMSPAPVGYWPLNETVQPPTPINLTATNSGSLGSQANGFYGAWYQPSGTTWYLTNSIVQTQAVTYPFDGSMAMQCQSAPGQYVIVPRNTNGVVNSALTLNPPFSLEAWVRIGRTNDALGTIVSQGGYAKLSTGGPNPANPYYGGSGSGWAGVELGQYDDYVFIQCSATNGTSKANELDSSSTYHLQGQHKGVNPGDWVHVVGTFDGTTEMLYTNGVLANSKNLGNNGAGIKYVADPTTPIMIGCNSQDTSQNESIAYYGSIHDVAIYPTVLSAQSVLNHFQTAYGTNATYGSDYTNAVLADAPSLYYRLNDAVTTTTNAGYTSASFPAAANYGALGAAGTGVYQPGTTPGVAGPAYTGFGANSKAVALNGWLGQIDIGGGTLPTALNPASSTPLTVVSWFQTAPADAPARYQDIVGHGDTGYRLELDVNSGGNTFTPGSGANNGQAQFDNQADLKTNDFACNDGKWHMVAGVYDGSSSVVMYIDGLLAKSNHLSAALSFTGSANDLLLGGSSQYTYASTGSGSTIRTFDGQIAQVAIWTNALSSAQIQQLYSVAAVPPTIVQQPPSPLTVNAGTNLSVTMLARGSGPLSYQWYKIGSGAVSGQTTSALTFNPVSLGNAGTYDVVVTNSAGTITSTTLALTVNGPPVVLAQSPTTIHVFTGTHPVLHASATGPQPISYQWTMGGSPVSGATASSYQPATSLTGTSTYSCTITNAYGGPAAFSPISVQVLNAPTAPYPAQVLADNPAYYFRLDEPDDNLGDGNPGATAWDYAGGCNAIYTNTALGLSGYSQGLANQDGYSPATEPAETAAQFGQTATADSYAGNGSSFLSFGAPTGSNAEFSVEAWYYTAYSPSTDAGLVAIGYGYGGEQFALDCGGKVNGSRTLRFYVDDASGANHGITATNVLLGDNLWHHVVAVCDEAGGKLSLYVDGVLNSSGAISSGVGLEALTTPLSIGARRSDSVNGYTNQFLGIIDDVSLYNSALTPGQVAHHFVAVGVPPTLVQAPPLNVVTNEGATVVLSASVEGTATLNYQWQLFGGNINGATTSTLTLPNVTASMSGNNYTLTVNNTYGSATTASSGGTTLTVNAGPPLILTDISPLNATNYVGNSMTYSVAVGGSAPFTYQWYQDGAQVPGATSSSFTLPTPSGQNTYYVSVTNAYSMGTPTISSTATLLGVPVPTLNPSDYNYKARITFAGYNRSEVLSDFPALVVLTNIPGFAYSQLADPSGSDLRFTDATGTRELPSEIDDWNPAGASTVWVQVPRLGTNTDAIWAYWGNPAATTPLAWSTNGGVWTPQPFEGLPAYQIVYHLKEGAFPFLDSTTLHSATNGSGTAPGITAGPVGTAASFNGGQFLDAGTNDFGDAFTLSAWLNIPSATVNIQAVWMEMHGGFGAPGYGLWVNTYNNSDNVIEFGSGGSGGAETKSSPGAFPFGGWHQLEAVVNRTNGTVNFFVDGSGLGVLTGVVTDFFQTNDVRLGEFLDNNFGIHGAMDEARVQAGNSSANWVWADYMTMGQNSAFESYGAALSSIVYITGQELGGGKLVLTWPNGTLLEATSVLGPWTTNLNTSPYTNTITGPQHFYRIRVR